MAEDFFAELGETLTKTAKDITSKADSFFESQKTRSKILNEQRMIDKTMGDIGNIVYKKYVDGEAIDEELTSLCEEITQRKVTIANFREEVAKMKGQKVCPACGATVPEESAFCMQCGAPCASEKEEVEPEVVEPEDVQPAAEPEQETQETKEDTQE